MDALRGSRGDDKIPRRLEDPRGTESLPKGDIEFPPRRPAPRQPRHDHALSHPFHYQPNLQAHPGAPHATSYNSHRNPKIHCQAYFIRELMLLPRRMAIPLRAISNAFVLRSMVEP
jgi:hypothetical protein